MPGEVEQAAAALTPAEIMADTLRLIADLGCDNLIEPWECRTDPARLRISEEGTATQWCDPCRARDALERAAVTAPPAPEQSQRWRRSVYSAKDRGTWHRIDSEEIAECRVVTFTRWPVEDSVTIGDQAPPPRGEDDRAGVCRLCVAAL